MGWFRWVSYYCHCFFIKDLGDAFITRRRIPDWDYIPDAIVSRGQHGLSTLGDCLLSQPEMSTLFFISGEMIDGSRTWCLSVILPWIILQDILLAKYLSTTFNWPSAIRPGVMEPNSDLTLRQGRREINSCLRIFSQKHRCRTREFSRVLTSRAVLLIGYLICYNQCLPQTYTVPVPICHGLDYIVGERRITNFRLSLQRFTFRFFLRQHSLDLNSRWSNLCIYPTRQFPAKRSMLPISWISCASHPLAEPPLRVIMRSGWDQWLLLYEISRNPVVRILLNTVRVVSKCKSAKFWRCCLGF